MSQKLRTGFKTVQFFTEILAQSAPPKRNQMQEISALYLQISVSEFKISNYSLLNGKQVL